MLDREAFKLFALVLVPLQTRWNQTRPFKTSSKLDDTLLVHCVFPDEFFKKVDFEGSADDNKARASDFFQDWWAEWTHGAKMVGHFLK